MKRLLILVLVCLTLLAAAGPVFAHAELLASNPEANAALDAAPAAVELSFSEALEPSFSSITVLDASGAAVDNGDSRVNAADPTQLTVSLRSLPDGVYTVSWKALSAVDGHVTTGAYPFAVGDVDAADLAAAEQASRQVRLSIGEVIARWLTYLSAAMLAGGLFFALLVWQPAVRSANAPASVAQALPLRILLLVAAMGFLAASVLTLLVHAGQATGVEIAAPWSQAAGNVLFHTRWGALWLGRLALLLAAAGWGLGPRPQRDLWLALGAVGLLLLGISLGSHAAAEPRPMLPVLADWVHLITASAWVGGLIAFAAGLWALRRAPEARAGLSLISHLLPRFSALALTSVAALALTGTYMAVLRLGSWDALTGTLYGRTLLVKLTLAAPMLLLGASNLLLVTPRVRRAAATGSDSGVAGWFRRSVTSEVTLGAAVLLSVGLFTALPPARIASSAPEIRRTATADDLSLTLTVSPGRVGLNTFSLRVTSGGRPVTDASEVLLRFTPSASGLAPSEAALTEQGEGVYSTRGAYLSLPDLWQIQSVVRRADQFDAFANYDLNVASGAAPVAAFPWHRVTGGLVLASALQLAFAANQLAAGSARRPTLSPRTLAPALALFAVGVVVFYQAPPGRPGANLINPVPPNASSVAIGRALYTTNCVPCHGPTGKGDGPVGVTLNPRPADLSLHAVPGVHTDGQLWLWVTNGFEGSVMPAFKTVLTDEQRWHVVNYVRTLAPK